MEINIEIIKMHKCISQVNVFKDCDEENINKWLLVDINDPGYRILYDCYNF